MTTSEARGTPAMPFDVTISNITRARAIIGVMGPTSRDLLARLTSADLGAGFPWLSARTIDVAGVPVGSCWVTSSYFDNSTVTRFCFVSGSTATYEGRVADVPDLRGHYARLAARTAGLPLANMGRASASRICVVKVKGSPLLHSW